MVGKYICICSILIGMLISNTQSSEDNWNSDEADFEIANSEETEKKDVGKTADVTSTTLPTPTTVLHGNGFVIDPNNFLGSPYIYYSQPSNTAVYPDILQLPPMGPILPAPSLIMPMGVAGDISIPFTGIEYEQPFALSNLCQSVPCPPDIIPTYPDFPQFLNSPIIVEEPEIPVFIPEPEPPIPPQLPVKVVVQNPSIPSPNHHITIASQCPPKKKCPVDTDPNSIHNFTKEMIKKLRRLMNMNSADETTEAPPPTLSEETFDSPPIYPTLSVQEMVTEHSVPHVGPNNEVKVIVNPAYPSQSSQYYYYRR